LFLQFFVAEKLGKTITELRNGMTAEELYAWSAYYTLKADAEKKAYEESRRQAQYRNMR